MKAKDLDISTMTDAELADIYMSQPDPGRPPQPEARVPGAVKIVPSVVLHPGKEPCREYSRRSKNLYDMRERLPSGIIKSELIHNAHSLYDEAAAAVERQEERHRKYMAAIRGTPYR